MKKRKEKPTAFEIAEFIIKVITAIISLITLIRKWEAKRGESPAPLGGNSIITQIRRFFKWEKEIIYFPCLYCLCFLHITA